MKDYLKMTGAIVVGLAAIALLLFFMQLLGFGLFKTFAPKYEQVRRETFEQSQAYNEGMRRDLESIRNEYLATTDPASKAALRATVHSPSGRLPQPVARRSSIVL